MIWKVAAFIPRIVDVHKRGYHPRDSNDLDNDDFMSMDENYPDWFYSNCRPPAILHTNREPRQEALKWYRLSFPSLNVDKSVLRFLKAPHTYFNWPADILYLDGISISWFHQYLGIDNKLRAIASSKPQDFIVAKSQFPWLAKQRALARSKGYISYVRQLWDNKPWMDPHLSDYSHMITTISTAGNLEEFYLVDAIFGEGATGDKHWGHQKLVHYDNLAAENEDKENLIAYFENNEKEHQILMARLHGDSEPKFDLPSNWREEKLSKWFDKVELKVRRFEEENIESIKLEWQRKRGLL